MAEPEQKLSSTFIVRAVSGEVQIELSLPRAALDWPIIIVKRRVWRALKRLQRAAVDWVPFAGCEPPEAASPSVMRLMLHHPHVEPSAITSASPGQDCAILLLYTLAVKTAEQDSEERALQVLRRQELWQLHTTASLPTVCERVYLLCGHATAFALSCGLAIHRLPPASSGCTGLRQIWR